MPYTTMRTMRMKQRNKVTLHFVGVLQKTLQVLVPVHELQKLEKQKFKLAKPQGADDRATNTLKVTNGFGQLEIEEIDESSLDAIPDASVERTEPRSTKKYEIDDEGEEWLFAVHCFYNDMHQIKDYLMRLWENYLTGDIDLATAAVTTNTAIDLIRRSEDDMRSSNLRLPEGYDKIGHSELPELWFMECCIRDGLAPPRNDAMKYMVPLEAWEQVEESFLLPFRLLSSSAKSAGEPIMITRPAWFGNYDPKLDRDRATVQQLYEQDTSLLMDMIVTLLPYGDLSNTPNDDELLKGLRKDLKPKHVPMYLVFGCQVFLDIHAVLQTRSERPFQDLYAMALDARRTLRGHDKFFLKHELTGYRDERSQAKVRDVHVEIEEWALNDQILRIFNEKMSVRKQRGQGHRTTQAKKVRVWKENEVLKMSPMLAGMWEYCFHLQMQVEGIRLVNETQIVTAVHLYNALQQGGYLPKDCLWVDAEYLLDIHAEVNTFMGERPISIEDCTKRLAIAQGVSPQTFAAGRRNTGHNVKFSRTGGKFLRPCTKVAGTFFDRFLSDGDIDISLHTIEKIIGSRLEERVKDSDAKDAFAAKLQTVFREQNAHESVEAMNKARAILDMERMTSEEFEALKRPAEPATDDELVIEAEDARDAKSTASWETDPSDRNERYEWINHEDEEKRILDTWKQHKKIDLCDYLTELGDALHSEHLDLQFDYFAFHRSTWRLLEALQEVCMPLVMPYLNGEMAELSSTDHMTTSIPCILMLMACDTTANLNILPIKPSTRVDKSGLQLAADVMKEFIEREGDAYAKREKGRLVARARETHEEATQYRVETGYSGATGMHESMDVQQTSEWLRDMQVEGMRGTVRRYNEHTPGRQVQLPGDSGQMANETSNASKKKKNNKKRKGKKKTSQGPSGGQSGSDEGLDGDQEQDKENLQPTVEEDLD